MFKLCLSFALVFTAAACAVDEPTGSQDSDDLVLRPPPVAKWVYLQGTGTNNCLDVKNGVPESTVVDNYTCNGSPSQEFLFNTNGTITNYWGYCLDVLGDNTNVGQLDFTTCNGTAAQQWRLHGTQIVGPAKKCLDVYGNNPTPGQVVDLATCNGTGAQVWNVINTPTALQGVGSKCLDIINSNTSPGARLQIFECNHGPNAQVFTFTGVGEIKNAVGECLDVMNGNAADGRVQMTTCNGTAAQHWTRNGRALVSALNDGLFSMCLSTVNTTGTGPSELESSADHTAVGLAVCDYHEAQQWVAADLFAPEVGNAVAGEPATLLVVTSDAFAPTFASFVNHKEVIGVPTKLLTVSQIRSMYPAVDDAASIKLAIEDNVRNFATKYVLLGGDGTQVPVRYRTVGDVGTTVRAFMNSDLYYANLYKNHSPGQGTRLLQSLYDSWDSNGNGLYDEELWSVPSVNADGVDGFPDVAVGRIPAWNTQVLNALLSKIIAYENTSPAYGGAGDPQARSSLVAADACYQTQYGIAQNIANVMPQGTINYDAEEDVGTCPSNHAPQPDPPPAGWAIDTSAWTYFQRNAQTGPQWITYVGHGPGDNDGANFSNNFWGDEASWTDSQVSQLTNTNPSIVVAVACRTGGWATTYRTEPGSFSPPEYDPYTTSQTDIGSRFLFDRATGGAVAYFGENLVMQDYSDFPVDMFTAQKAGFQRIGDIYRMAQQAFFDANASNTDDFMMPRIYNGIMTLLGDPSMRTQ
ncbi:MAG TPA: ricin-type beta-trefoil lectin domain protein [Kofleriaceae bacterium]|nr:ricin-type beta-trefoil lectin domain protein [Kofleriaceae bacterium]